MAAKPLLVSSVSAMRLSSVCSTERMTRDRQADEDGGEGAQGDFPPDAEVHAGTSDSRSLYPSDLIEMMASSSSGSFCLSRRTWTSTVRVVP